MFGKTATPAEGADKADVKGETAANDDDEQDVSKAKNGDGEGEEHEGEEEQEEKPKSKQSSWFSALSSINYSALLSTAQDAMANIDPDELEKRKGQVSGEIAKRKEQMMAATKDLPADKAQLMHALAAQQNATGLLQSAAGLKDKAMKCLDPNERQRMIQEAYDKEIEANGQSKMARRMQSGTWQGGIGGAGIGGGVGMGVGTVVGTLVGGVVSLPTTALGGLVGMGVGGIHGPFVKLNQKKAQEVAEREQAKGKSPKEIEAAVQAEALEEAVDEGLEEVPEKASEGAAAPPPATISQPQVGSAKKNLQRQQSSPEGAALSQPNEGSAKRNLQRQQSSGPAKAQAIPPRDPNQPRKKPRKLEVRSNKTASNSKG